MGFLGLGKKPPAAPRKKRRAQDGDTIMKSIAARELKESAAKDSKVRAQILNKLHGIDVVPEDDSKAIERELKTSFFKKLKKKYEDADESTEFDEREAAVLDRLIGTGSVYGRSHYYGGPYEGEYEVPNPLDIISQYREIEQNFGGGSWSSMFKDPDVAVALIGLFERLVKGDKAAVGNGGSRVFVVDGVEMNEETYRLMLRKERQIEQAESRLIEQKTTEEKPPEKPKAKEEKPPADKPAAGATKGTKPRAVINSPTSDGDIVTVTPIYAGGSASVPPEESETEADEGKFNLLLFLPYADEIANSMDNSTPEEFALELIQAAESGNKDAASFVEVLKKISFDEIMELVESERDNNVFAPYIAKLETNKAWVEEALAKIKQLKV